jgi:hypothetical protein
MSGPVDERNALLRALDSQRRHVIGTVEALHGDQLRTATLPSGWTPLGLVRHLTLSDERYWFDSIVGGEPLDWFPEGPGADWVVDPSESADDVVAAYRDQIRVSNGWIERTDIDAPPRRPDPAWAEWGIDFPDLRTVMLHMIVETATHAGHLDVAVELIDGRQHLVLD